MTMDNSGDQPTYTVQNWRIQFLSFWCIWDLFLNNTFHPTVQDIIRGEWFLSYQVTELVVANFKLLSFVFIYHFNSRAYVIVGEIKESESCGLLSTCVLHACRAAMPLNHSPYVCGVGGFRGMAALQVVYKYTCHVDSLHELIEWIQSYPKVLALIFNEYTTCLMVFSSSLSIHFYRPSWWVLSSKFGLLPCK